VTRPGSGLGGSLLWCTKLTELEAPLLSTKDLSLAQDFTDSAGERALLAAIAADPSLYWELQGSLPADAFLHEASVWKQLLQAIETDQPGPRIEGAGTSQPHGLAARLADLTQRRMLADLQESLGRALYSETSAQTILTMLEERTAQARLLLQEQSHAGLSGLEVAAEVIALAQERWRLRTETGSSIGGLLTGLKGLDNVLNGLNPGLHVLAGAPGVGKTTLSLQIALHVASQGHPVVYVTYENSPVSLVSKALCAQAGISSSNLERGFADVKALQEAVSTLVPSLQRLSIIEGTSKLTLAQIRGKALQLAARFPTRSGLVIFDYLQRAAHGSGFDQLRHNVSALAGDLRDLSNRLQSPILALSSQNRSSGAYGNGGGSAALDSLKESGDLEYSADSVLFLKRSERAVQDPARAVDLVVAKNRYGAADMTLPMIFRPDLGRLREA
jgi:replicative DNA helicase